MPAASFQSIPEMFLHRVSSTPDAEALSFPVVGSSTPGGGEAWKTMVWREVGERVRAIAGGLRALGLEDEQRSAILSSTRIEWILCDLGILCAGGATTTIYPSNTPEECAYILTDSNTRFVFAENDAQVAKLIEQREHLGNVAQVITFDGKSQADGWVITLAELEEKGRAWNQENPGRYEEIARGVKSDSLATLIYTSGTTGKPKGVELLHDCWVFEAEAMDNLGFLSPADKQFLFLPLAHSFGKVLEVAIIRIGIPTAVDGRLDKLVDDLAVVRPTFMAAVPRVFEKVYNKIVSNAKEGGALKYRIFRWSLEVGRQCSQLKQKGELPRGWLSLRFAIADKLVFHKIKALFGGRVRFLISGGAPLSREIAEFFHAADVLVLEGYGLTESGAASFVNRPDRFKFGTVGLPLPGVQVRIAEEDGEIFIHSRGVMRGYHNLPDVTAEALTDDHWLRTGDIGVIDADGFLKITDRKKDLIKTSGGKYVAPQMLEGKLKTHCPYISQVLVHGNLRNFCTALVTLDEEAIMKWAGENGKAGRSYRELAADPDVHALIQRYVDELNSTLASYETIKKFAILPQDLTIETGELTPSMKVKRKVVETRYKDVLDGFYEGTVETV